MYTGTVWNFSKRFNINRLNALSSFSRQQSVKGWFRGYYNLTKYVHKQSKKPRKQKVKKYVNLSYTLYTDLNKVG